VNGSSISSSNPFSRLFLQQLQTAYGFNDTQNSEIRFRWLMLHLQNTIEIVPSFILENLIQFITSQGRMKFVRPLYRAMRKSIQTRVQAVETFQVYKEMYHPIARKMIESDLERVRLEEEGTK
jgi:leukotriene-A4 hydrolase